MSINSNIRKHLLRRISENTIEEMIHAEQMDIWVCSFGGTASNTLSNYLESKGFNTRTATWKKYLCHYPNPLEFDSMPNLKAIYIFDNPLRALASQKRRGWRWYYTNYLKLKNSKLGLYSDQKMLSVMVRQFEAWNSFNSKSLPICSIPFDQLFDASNKKLSNFLGIDCSDFPPIVERSSTKLNMHLPKNLKASVDDIISLL